MSFTKCNYVGCNQIRRSSSNKFYSFPVKDKERCQEWIFSCGNLKMLDVEPEQLKNMGICEKHFTENSFVNATHHRLRHSAVPVNFSVCKPQEVQLDSTTTSSSSESSTGKTNFHY